MTANAAVIQFDPDIELFRGAVSGLNGDADVYAERVSKRNEEGRISLRVFLEKCRGCDIAPTKP